MPGELDTSTVSSGREGAGKDYIIMNGDTSDFSDDDLEDMDDLQEERPRKLTSYHMSVQDHEETPCHFLVPTVAERDVGDVDVGAARRRGAGGGLTWYHTPDTTAAIDEQTTGEQKAREFTSIAFDPGYEWPFSAKMIPVNYSECMSVTGQGPERQESYISYCDIILQRRCKETVHISPGLSPQSYRSSIVVYKNCSKKRYKNVVNYTTKMKPKRWEETNYIQGRKMEKTFVSFLDYDANKQKNWFTSSVELQPKTWSHNHVHNFEFRERADSYGSECVEEMTSPLSRSTSEDEGIYNGDVTLCLHSPEAEQQIQRLKLMNGDIDMTLVSSSLHGDSFIADDNDSDTLSYRAKLVINANRPPSYCGDEVMSNGYASDDIDL